MGHPGVQDEGQAQDGARFGGILFSILTCLLYAQAILKNTQAGLYHAMSTRGVAYGEPQLLASPCCHSGAY